MITSDDFILLIKDLNKINSPYKLGKIDAAHASGRPKILFDGETVSSGKTYPFLSSYTPAANDRVLLIQIAGSYIVIGKII